MVHSEKHPEQSTTYKFDRIFDPSDAQPAVYEEVQHLVTSCLDGFNVCIMAYGQTGSGKTHTMVGNEDEIYYYAINELFKRLEDRPLSDHKLRVSLEDEATPHLLPYVTNTFLKHDYLIAGAVPPSYLTKRANLRIT